MVELAPNELFFIFVPHLSRGYLEVGVWYHIIPVLGGSHYHMIPYFGAEKSGMKSNPLVQRNKYQNGFYRDAI